MAEATSGDTFLLDVASRAEHVPLARLFISVLARMLNLAEPTVEDLKLAVSEVVSAIVIAGQADRLSVVAVAEPDGALHVEIGPVTVDDLSLEGVGPDPVAVVEAIFPGVQIGGGRVRFAVPAPVAS